MMVKEISCFSDFNNVIDGNLFKQVVVEILQDAISNYQNYSFLKENKIGNVNKFRKKEKFNWHVAYLFCVCLLI